MKNDQYIPHEVNIRNNPQVMDMIEGEGAGGYGIYWALLEYLRTQDDYKGNVRATKGVARQLKAHIGKVVQVLEAYNLFVIEGDTFYSPSLIEKMQPLERKRAQEQRMQESRQTLSNNVQSLSKNEQTLSESSCNSLKTSDALSIVKKSKTKKSTSSSKEEKKAAEAVLPLSNDRSWENHVDDLCHDQIWVDLMAEQSGLKQKFYRFYPKIVDCFKRHVRSLGKENHIMSIEDAKQYFCSFLKPGRNTFEKVMDEIRAIEVKNPYRFEQRDPVTGARSYCGVLIPEDAPPRPNNRAEWCDGKWLF